MMQLNLKPKAREPLGLSQGVQRCKNQKLRCPRVGKDGLPSSSREKREFTPPSPFCCIRVLSGLVDTQAIGKGGSHY